jgi:hypothetical protein
MCGLTEPGLQITIPRLMSFFIDTTQQQTSIITSFSSIEDLTEHLNTSNGRSQRLLIWPIIPTISTGSPVLITPRSIRPVATVPRPVIENTSSTGIKKSCHRTNRLRNLLIHSSHQFSDRFYAIWIIFQCFQADPGITAALSPSNSY